MKLFSGLDTWRSMLDNCREDDIWYTGGLAYSVVDALSIATRRYHVVITKKCKVTRNFGLAFAEMLGQIADGSFFGCQQADDL